MRKSLIPASRKMPGLIVLVLALAVLFAQGCYKPDEGKTGKADGDKTGQVKGDPAKDEAAKKRAGTRATTTIKSKAIRDVL